MPTAMLNGKAVEPIRAAHHRSVRRRRSRRMHGQNERGYFMTLPDYLTQDADGYIHVKGHRIGLQDFVFYYNEGYFPEALLEAFPTLSLALVHKMIAFYLEQTADVDAYMVKCEAEMERQQAAAPRGPDMAELRRRLAAKQAAEA